MSVDPLAEEPSDSTRETVRPPTGQPWLIRDYEILRELHRGGQGIVYVALQRSTKRKVALKLLLAERQMSKAARQRFDREIEVVAQLRHPNIVAIFDSGMTRGNLPFFVMDYVRGRTLREYARSKRPSLEQAMDLMAQVCEAIQHAHQRGIIHRDVKPSNILVDGDGHPYVLDFGLAKFLTGPLDANVTLTGEVFGTLRYMTPEHVRGNPNEIDTRSDVYALGVVLYELLTGGSPYPCGEQIDRTMRHIVETPAVAPSLIWKPDSGVRAGSIRRLHSDACPIDDDVDTIVLRALAKERERRYQSAGELARDLRHWLAGEPIEAKRDHRGYLLKMALRRHKAAAVVASLFVLLLFASAVATSALYLSAETARSGEEHQRREAERHLYAAHMNLAYQEWERGNVGRVRQLLDRHLGEHDGDDLRSFEWRHLWRLTHTERLSLEHDPMVLSVAFSPCGTMLATGGRHDLRLFDAVTGELKRRFVGPISFVFGVAFSPDGKLLAAGGQDETVRLWEVETGAEVAVSKSGIVRSVAFSPDGARIVVAGGTVDASPMLSVLSVPDLVPVMELAGHEGFVMAAVYSPDGKTLATAGADGLIRLWNAATGEALGGLPAAPVRPPETCPLSFSPDGQLLAGPGSSPDGAPVIDVWDLRTREKQCTLRGHRKHVCSIAFSPDGRLLLSGSDDKTLKLWTVANGETMTTLQSHLSYVYGVAFSPLGTQFASGGADGFVKVWSAGSRQEPLSLEGVGDRGSAALAGDGRTLATGGQDKVVKLWDIRTGVQLSVIEGHQYPIRRIAFSPDAKILVTASAYVPKEWRAGYMMWGESQVIGELKVWRLPEGIDTATTSTGSSLLEAVAISPDGSTLATVTSEPPGAALTLWRLPKLEPYAVLAPGTAVEQSLAFSPDGSKLAAGASARAVVIWDLGSHEHRVLEGHAQLVKSVAFSPDGRLLATASLDGTVRLWGTEDGRHVRTLKEHTDPVAVAFCPDGKTIATAGLSGNLTLWDVATGEVRAAWESAILQPRVLAFTPDAQTLVAAGTRATTVWHAQEMARHTNAQHVMAKPTGGD